MKKTRKINAEIGTFGFITLHGMSRTPEYMAWRNMRIRCADQGSYCGRKGIRVCAQWQEDFAAFLRDVGKRPNRNMLLDRKNNDGNYEPGNVRWVTSKISASNRDNRHIGTTIFGEHVGTAKLKAGDVRTIRQLRLTGLTLQSIALRYDVSRPTIGNIIRGMTWKRVA